MEPFKPGSVTRRSTWIDKKEVLDYMRIGERTLQKWRSNGIIPHYNIAGRIYYCEEDLETMLLANKRFGTKRKKGNENEKE